MAKRNPPITRPAGVVLSTPNEGKAGGFCKIGFNFQKILSICPT
jgi:hypothetical protein